ncbi:MAG: CsbD family protein [Thermoplasmatota archaeon]
MNAAYNKAAGKVKKTAGRITGRPVLEVKGNIQEGYGKLQAVGKTVRRAARSARTRPRLRRRP